MASQVGGHFVFPVVGKNIILHELLKTEIVLSLCVSLLSVVD